MANEVRWLPRRDVTLLIHQDLSGGPSDEVIFIHRHPVINHFYQISEQSIVDGHVVYLLSNRHVFFTTAILRQTDDVPTDDVMTADEGVWDFIAW